MYMKPKSIWYETPTKKQMILVVLLFVTGLILVFISITNLFTETPLKARFIIMYLLMLGSAMTVFNVCRNFFKKSS